MNFQDFHKNILKDLKIELADEFDRNFERKAFFDKKWPTSKFRNNKGSLMARSNNLRRGYRAKIENDRIVFSNSMPYASIHNEGGEITVTAKMKKFFWAMHYKHLGATKAKRDGTADRRYRDFTIAGQYKALALMPIGKKMTIPERRVIGDHPKIKTVVKQVVDYNLEDLNDFLQNQLRQR